MEFNLPVEPRNILLLQIIVMTTFVYPEWMISARRTIRKKIESLKAVIVKKDKRSGGAHAKFFEIDMSKFE